MSAILLLERFFQDLHQLIHSHDFKKRHILRDNAFSRNRKLPFEHIVSFLLSLPKKSMVTELDSLFEQLKLVSPPTKQAFSIARQHISHLAFKELFFKSAELHSLLPSSGLWHGHRIFAIDGTTLSLPRTPETISVFGVKKWYSKSCVIPKVSMLYDVSNDLICDVIFGNVRSGERVHAEKFLDSPALANAASDNSVLLLDRGYPSRKLIQQFHQKNLCYLMRCSKSFLASVNDAPLGDSKVTDIHQGVEIPLRVIKFVLDSGEIEMLVTNLFSSALQINNFKELYFLRWGIETKYGELKNRLLIEKFCAKKPECILQEFYAHLFVSNITAVMKKCSDERIRQENKRKPLKWKYQSNRSYLLGLLAKNMLSLLLRAAENLLERIIEKAAKKRSPLRPNRKSERSGTQYRKTFDMNLKTHL